MADCFLRLCRSPRRHIRAGGWLQQMLVITDCAVPRELLNAYPALNHADKRKSGTRGALGHTPGLFSPRPRGNVSHNVGYPTLSYTAPDGQAPGGAGSGDGALGLVTRSMISSASLR